MQQACLILLYITLWQKGRLPLRTYRLAAASTLAAIILVVAAFALFGSAEGPVLTGSAAAGGGGAEQAGGTAAGKPVALEGAGYTQCEQCEGVATLGEEQLQAVLTSETGFIEWEFAIEEAGSYNIEVTYYTVPGRGSSIERQLSIDGENPLNEVKGLSFQRIWQDETAIVRDARDNDIRPRQVEKLMWVTTVLQDSLGYEREPYRFWLEPGIHTLRLTSVSEPMAIGSLRLFPAEKLPSYEELVAEYPQQGAEGAGGAMVKIQAEQALYKSDPTMFPIYDRSSAATEPAHPAKIRLNTIGADKWKYPGQSITWRFSVPESGQYQIALRARQHIASGQFSSRKLYIDGKVPFLEAAAIPFPYSSDWQMFVLGNGDEAYRFYLEVGEHTITLEATLGSFAAILQDAEDSVYELNAIYRKILMLTGPEPDIYRDYDFKRELPDVLEALAEQSAALQDIQARIVAIVGAKGAGTAVLERAISRIDSMLADTQTIPAKFKDFKENVIGLGAWLLAAQAQPLEIDYMLISAPEQKLPKAGSGLVAGWRYSISSFAASFFNNYDAIGDVFDTNEALKVWIPTGRDQAQILKQLIDNYFTPQTGIQVNLSLVPPESVLPATLAGKGPEVVLSVGASDPVNYAIRKAVVDLRQFADYEQVAARFHPSATVPYAFNGGAYALPETQTFPMLFYRTDILEDELGLEAFDTWPDIFRALPEIQKRYMEFALPSTMQSYAMLLYQNGGSFYDGQGTATRIGDETGIESFKQWTKFYTSYKLPLSYDMATRFRSGEMPIGIADYTFYNLLSVFAPEIEGLWKFVPVPGTMQEDGTIDRSSPGSGTGSIMLESARNKEHAWAFLKWWTDAQTQVMFGRELESIMGAAARYPTANLEALDQMPWHVKDAASIAEQWDSVFGIPEVPGGYIVPREIDFAFRSVVLSGNDPREAMLDYAEIADMEIAKKRREFGLE